ncbi:SPOR domain-containing protein [Jiella endophytica]|uniref:SPOR domain-containing protein n=1 Tax=Jiella endophytica TaxID=2558362 RepID=A0A4Y8RE22_9HYPH|nr:SPOR domain-containing protein [Jiella endophytica]TFF19716.1 SPOR domain-containing protein [Jiella endophytica]
MGDLNGSARAGGQAFDAELDDPFEELARILEAPLQAGAHPGKPTVQPHVVAPEAVEPLADSRPQVAAKPAPAKVEPAAPRAPATDPAETHQDLSESEMMSAALTQELSDALDLAAADFEAALAEETADLASVEAPEVKPQAAAPQPAAAAPARQAPAPRPQQAAVAQAPQPAAPKDQPVAAAPAPQAPAPKPQPAAAAPAPHAPAPKPQQAVAAPAPQAQAPHRPAPKPQPVAAAPAPQAPAPRPQQAAAVPAPQASAQKPQQAAAAPAPQAEAPKRPAPKAQPAAATPAPKAPAPKQPAAHAEPAAAAAALAGFDLEFEQALRGLSEPANPRQTMFHHAEAFAPDRQPVAAEEAVASQVFDDFDELIASELAAIKQEAPQAAAAAEEAPADNGYEPEWPDSFGSDGDFGSAGVEYDEMPRPAAAYASRGFARRSGFVGAGLGALALMLAAGGAYVFLGSGPGTVSDGSVLVVRADPDPVKVKPENPGGREIPNQNKMVYSRVKSGDAMVTPEQKELVSAQEEPIDLPTDNPPISDLPGVELGVGSANAAERPTETADAGNRSADAYSEASPIAVLSPRRAKTYSVRSDGTLVVSDAATGETIEESRPRGPLIEASARPVDLQQTAGTIGAVASGDTAGVAAAEPAAAAAETAGVPAPNIPVPTLRPSPAGAPRQAAAAPAAPVAPTPAAEPDAIQTAALEPQPAPSQATDQAPAASEAAPEHDGYYVQISSQPSRDAAEASSRNLGQRYAGVIAGRNVVIQSADIPGKGTYYRVRVPVDSRTEGARLCGDLKSAGGSCFVSR